MECTYCSDCMYYDWIEGHCILDDEQFYNCCPQFDFFEPLTDEDFPF